MRFNKLWKTWLIFGLCLSLVFVAMGWISVIALKLEKNEAKALQHAQKEENVRLALWRMDSLLSPFIGEENSRPYIHYSSFYAAQSAFTKMYTPVKRGEILIPSPLLTGKSIFTIVHFQFDPTGKLSSPQVPEGNMRDLAESRYIQPEVVDTGEKLLEKLKKIVDHNRLFELLKQKGDIVLAMNKLDKMLKIAVPVEKKTSQYRQMARNVAEFEARFNVQNAAPMKSVDSIGFASQSKIEESYEGDSTTFGESKEKPAIKKKERQIYKAGKNVLKPVWINEDLFLVRCFDIAGKIYIQGLWLSWNEINKRLLSKAKDLLPNAKLEGVSKNVKLSADSSLLASLPVKLVPGSIAFEQNKSISTVKLSLFISWICVFLGAGAVAVFVVKTVSLSEKRADFVSAVTHELRTPLTTFKMYTEMLSSGMVPDENKKKKYLNILSIEADRLGHLVENVLAFAKLERGRAGAELIEISVYDLFNRFETRLIDRVKLAGMELNLDLDSVDEKIVFSSPVSIEHIMFNLVDNACKYASQVVEKKINIQCTKNGDDFVYFRISDRGPGIKGDFKKKLFQPFSKSAKAAAGTAPGVGLGLALSQRLAKDLGGSLDYDSTFSKGASFILKIPLFKSCYK